MTQRNLDQLTAASRGFRDHYLDWSELEAQLHAWADAFPELVRLDSIGKTAEGRDLWLLTLGPEPDRIRPAVWVDGNMHANELCGSSVALAMAEDVLRLHLAPDTALQDLPVNVRDRVREVLFHVLPRMSPDGAEAILKTGRYVRSVPRDLRPNQQHPRWISEDVDGDGLSLLMRVEDPTGEFAASDEIPDLLLPRRIDDAGPFFKVYPEGTIEHFDGATIPSPGFLSDNEPDLNRNFPWSWAPEPEQLGAGAFPASEPESRAVVEFAVAHPNLFSWLNLHTFGGVFIRPLGHAPDNKMDPSDLALFRQLEAWGEELTGYPMVSGFEEFTYEPDKPLHGDLSDFAYNQRGCIGYVCELWDLFRQIGMEKRKRFVDHYTHLTREDLVNLARWDAEHNDSRAILPWRSFEHPQLGQVEIGGLDPRIGLWNPPPDRIDEICLAQSAMYLRVAALAPRLVVAAVEAHSVGADLTRIEVRVENHGYLPTYVLSSASTLPWNEAPWVDVVTGEGCALVDPADTHREVGHLDGWGRGLFDGTGALYYMRSRGNTGSATLRFVVRGQGTVQLRVGSCRVGWTEEAIEVG